MKNKLTDLNDHLFAQLERLGDEEINDCNKLNLSPDNLEAISRNLSLRMNQNNYKKNSLKI